MKDLLKNSGLMLLGMLLAILLLTNWISTCTEKKAEKLYNETELNTAVNEKERAVSTKYLQQLADLSVVIQEKNKLISDGLKPVIKWKTVKAKQAVEVALKDTNTTDAANTAINQQEELIFDLETKAYYDSIQLFECNKRHIVKDSIAKEIMRAYNVETEINQQLQKKVKRNWIERNKLWIGVIVGATATGLILK